MAHVLGEPRTNLNTRKVTIRRNRAIKSVVKSTKARKPRTFTISPELAEALRPLIEGRKPDEPLFLSPEGFRLHPENLVKRKLKPVLQKVGAYVKGTACHGFRHAAATRLDELGTHFHLLNSLHGFGTLMTL